MSALLDPEASAEVPSFTWANVSVTEGVAEVSLVAKGKASRQGAMFWLEMPKLFAWLEASRDVRVVIVRGEGEGFSHGLDFMDMAPDLAGVANPQCGPRDRTRLYELILRMQEATSCVARCKKPVIAAVHGWCIGAGVDLITACDIRICSADAKFSVREVKVAIVADMGSLARLPGIIGQGATRELAFTGEDVDATRALALGLVSRVHASAEMLLTEARSMAKRIAENPPLVVEGIKRVMNISSEARVQENLTQVAVWNAAFMPSSDLGEAMTAFAERRAPVFRGE